MYPLKVKLALEDEAKKRSDKKSLLFNLSLKLLKP